VQVISPSAALRVHEIDLTLLPLDAAELEAERIALVEATTTFDIAAAPLVRVVHVRLTSRRSIVMVTAHHLVCDGWSMGILSREMGALCADPQLALVPLPFSYADYVDRERSRLAVASFEVQRAALRDYLDGYQRFEVETDFPRPSTRSERGDIASVLIDRPLTDALADLAQAHGCTLFMTVYALAAVVLARVSDHNDVVLSTQIAGREDPDFDSVVGTFVNTVALRTCIAMNEPFAALLERVRDNVCSAFEFRDVPVGVLVDAINPRRDLSRPTLFSVNFIFQRSFVPNASYGSFSLVDLPSVSTGAMYDLNFFMVERPEGWRLSCEYDSTLFAAATVSALLDRLLAIMHSASTDPGRLVSELPWIPLQRPANSPPKPSRSLPSDLDSRSVAEADGSTSVLAKVRAIVAEILSVECVGPDDDLFAAGLHSLLAMRLLAAVKSAFGVEITLRSLVKEPTVRGLVTRVEILREVSASPEAPKPIVVLNGDGTKPPLFFFYRDVATEGLYCSRLATALGADQPIYLVAPHGTMGLPNLSSVEEMALDHIERIREIHSGGPYRLGGFCLGGLVAYEIARLLRERGEDVDRLILVNSVALPQRSIPMIDWLVRRIGLSSKMTRKWRARLCFNLAWLHAMLVSNPMEMVSLTRARFTKVRNHRAAGRQAAEYPESADPKIELIVAAVHAASFTYHRKHFDGDITLLWGVHQETPPDVPAREWRQVARNVRLIPFQGGRLEPLNEDLGEFAAAIADALGG
jgi:thioesterase domain-containing protein/acyl carrier protein